MTHMSKYQKVRADFDHLFKAADRYVKEHPGARLECDELGEEEPTIGFVHREGVVSVHTVFVLHREIQR